MLCSYWRKNSCDTYQHPTVMAITLHTPRLTLRELQMSDAEFVLELLNEPSFKKFIGDKRVRNIADAEHYIVNGPVASYARHGFGLLLVHMHDAVATPIGICGLLQRDTLAHPDIGFAYLPAFWGCGYGFEAAGAVLDDARQRLRLPQLLGLTSPDNVASIRLLEKLGLRFERVIHLTGGNPGTNLYSMSL
jgi:[ribosomal protein S5]-alanine N-acetyltransferase